MNTLIVLALSYLALAQRASSLADYTGKISFWKRINQACKMLLYRKNRNSSCICSATVISFLFSTMNATIFGQHFSLFRAKKCGEEGKFPLVPPPAKG